MLKGCKRTGKTCPNCGNCENVPLIVTINLKELNKIKEFLIQNEAKLVEVVV